MSLHCIRKDAQVYFSRSAAPWCAQTRRAQCPSTGPPPHRRPSRGPPMPTCFLLFLNNGHQSHNLVPIGGLVAFDHRSGSFCFLRPEFLRVNEPHRSASSLRQRIDHPPPPRSDRKSRVVWIMSTSPSAARNILQGNATPIGHLAGEAYGWPGALCPSWVLGTEYMRHRVRIRGQLVA